MLSWLQNADCKTALIVECALYTMRVVRAYVARDVKDDRCSDGAGEIFACVARDVMLRVKQVLILPFCFTRMDGLLVLYTCPPARNVIFVTSPHTRLQRGMLYTQSCLVVLL